MAVDLSKIADFPKMLIRLPPELREALNEAAKASGRSVNAEVVARLEASFAVANRPFTPEQEARVAEMVKDHAEAVVKRLMQEVEKSEREIAEEAAKREAARHA